MTQLSPAVAGTIESTHGPIDRTTLALFAGASGDHVPLHIDSDYAKAAGMDDVFAHGMLVMAYMGQLLTGNHRPEQVREWSVRFRAITPLHATVRCTAEPAEPAEGDAAGTHRLSLVGETDQGVRTIEGYALISDD